MKRHCDRAGGVYKSSRESPLGGGFDLRPECQKRSQLGKNRESWEAVQRPYDVHVKKLGERSCERKDGRDGTESM